MLYAAGPQLPAHHPGQRAGGGLADITRHQQVGTQLIASAHTADNRYPQRLGRLDEVQLGRYGIYGIHNAVKAGKVDLIGVFRHIKNGVFRHFNIGVDIPQPGGHHGGLWLPYGGMQCHQLAVQVAFTHGIVVDEGQLPHTGPAQGLTAPAAHAPQAKDGHLFAGKCFNGFLPQQQGRPFKLAHAFPSRRRASFCWRISRPTNPSMV